MGKIKFSIHPLFFAFGFYFCLQGEFFIFLIYSITALIHELGHSIVSGNLGYRLKKITLMPFGAIAEGDIDGLKLKDEIIIALSGPAVNIIIGLAFIAVWWIFPESYPYTETAVSANLSMALINFIPAYPLDGGRVLSALLAGKLGRKKARKVSRILSVVFAVLLFALFIVSIFGKLNLSLLFFALFVFFSGRLESTDNEYVKAYTLLSPENLSRGVPIYRQAVDESITLKKLMSILDGDRVNELAVYSNGKLKASLNQQTIFSILEKGDIYAPLSAYV